MMKIARNLIMMGILYECSRSKREERIRRKVLNSPRIRGMREDIKAIKEGSQEIIDDIAKVNWGNLEK